MKKLKIFVGLDGKWVLCEKFPDDENHAGLHEMLDDLVNEGIELNLPVGTYYASFEINMDFKFNPMADQSDAYLDFVDNEFVRVVGPELKESDFSDWAKCENN